eukprot:COSAG02_NODE_14038_length_1318_cov_25.128440_2_plen_44_part_01
MAELLQKAHAEFLPCLQAAPSIIDLDDLSSQSPYALRRRVIRIR